MNKINPICTELKEVFVQILIGLHQLKKEEAEAVYEREARYFTNFIEGTKDLTECTDLSKRNSFTEIAQNYVSIQPGARAEAYLESRSANIGKRESPNWIKVCSLRIQAYGELNMRLRAGQLIHASNPIVIYEGDVFQPCTNLVGDLIVEYKPAIPRKSNKIMGCYVQLTLRNGIKDYKWLLEDDIRRLQSYSAKALKNETGNGLYGGSNGQIDPGFLEAKTIKHALKTLPRLRLSEFVVLDDDDFNVSENENTTFEDTFSPAKSAEENEAVSIATDDNGLF